MDMSEYLDIQHRKFN